MQTQISAEEFARFQAQLLQLRQEKYAADEATSRAHKQVLGLEEALAHKSGELAELRSSLSRIQRAGDIDAVFRENQTLRQRLINIESSFHLQTATLRAECERLQSENSVLLATLKTAGLNSSSSSSNSQANDQTTQTNAFPQISIALQTYKPGWGCASLQTDITCSDLDELTNRLHELNGTDTLLDEERKTSENLYRQLSARELDVERLEGECEAIRNELIVTEKRGERVQKELKRQLASAMRAAKQAAANTTSSSSLVYVQQVPQQQNCDTISIGSFSLCGTGNGTHASGHDGELSETSSSSPAQPQAFFSEEDLKVSSHFMLLNHINLVCLH